MKDYQASLEKLRADAAEAALIRDRATQNGKHDIFDQLHRHFTRLADMVEQAMLDTGPSARIAVIFCCSKCNAGYEAAQERLPVRVSGLFRCQVCSEILHSWSGEHDFTDWKAIGT